MNSLKCTLVIAALGLSSAALGDAAGAPSAELIKTRIANFHRIGSAFKGIRDALRTGAPAALQIQQFAGRIESLGLQIPSWFPPGTGAEAQSEGRDSSRQGRTGDGDSEDGKTRAKSEIWTDRGGFEAAHRRFLAEAKKMDEVAKSGDKAAMTAQYKMLGAACKNCHNTFRE